MRRPDLPPPLRRYAPWLAFAALAALVFAAYYRGLGGPFLLDDWGTLSKLGAYGPVTNFDTLLSYLTAGISGPGGRPIALASFLIDSHYWPADPWPFKLTNVLIHLLNGALLAWLLAGLSRARGLDARKAAWAGLAGAGLWLAHPLFVSTTLYVVQRMAMLAALFVFAGLGCYVAGRRRLDAGRGRSGYALMIGGLAGGTVLGFFSKENAALLPLLALVLEATVLARSGLGTRDSGLAKNRLRRFVGRHKAAGRCRHPDAAAGNAELIPAYKLRTPEPSARNPSRLFRLVFLWLPGALIVAYLAWRMRYPFAIVPGRDFSIATRLLTEARVLVHYLYLLVVPHARTHGLYTVVPLSHGFLHPWTTLPAIAFILALLAAAFALRRRRPVFAAVVLFFFAGQLLESTTIPLELYYEHRNYLPAALLFWPLGLWWVNGRGLLRLRRATPVIAFALLLALTALRANLWGQPTRLALTWMKLNPDSVRAVVVGTDTLEALGHKRLAYGRLYVATKAHPDSISAALARVGAACELGGARPDDVRALIYAAGHDRARHHLLYTTLISRIANREHCPGFGPRAMAAVVAAAQGNVHFRNDKSTQQNLLVLRGQLLLSTGKADAAYRAFRTALALHPTPDAALTLSATLMGAHHPRQALGVLNEYRGLPAPAPPGRLMARVHRAWLEHIGWYSESFHALRAAIEKALQKSAHPPLQRARGAGDA